MDSSCIGPNPSQMADYHWVSVRVVPKQVPTQNQQPSYAHYYVGAETTFHNMDHLYLWNVLLVELRSVGDSGTSKGRLKTLGMMT